MTGSATEIRAAVPVAAEPRWARWLTYFPLLAGGGLATLYAIGALMRTTQLMGADLSVRDTLPLVPIQQLLAVGIGTAVKSLVLLPILLLFCGLTIWSDRWAEQRPPQRRRDVGRGHIASMAGLGTMLLVSLTTSVPAGLSATFLATMAFLIATGMALSTLGIRPPLPRPWSFLVFLTVSSITMTIASAFIYPAPLPTVTLERHGLPPLHGHLVADTGSSWYVADHKNHFVSVPSARVSEARVQSKDPGHQDSVAELLGIPLGLYR